MRSYEEAVANNRLQPSSTHYSLAQNSKLLTQFAEAASLKILEITDNRPDQAVLVYRGFSGTTAATAITVVQAMQGLEPSSLVYIRKKEEKTHGRSDAETNTSLYYDIQFVFFVDDFIQTGATAKACLISLYTLRPALALKPIYFLLQGVGRELKNLPIDSKRRFYF